MTTSWFASAKILTLATLGILLLSPPTPTQGGGITPPQADPLLSYVQPPDALVTVARAEDILAAECMNRFGFDDYQNQDYDRLAASFEESDERLYGITNSRIASDYGYLPAPSPVRSSGSAEWDSPDYRAALLGDVEALAQGRATDPEPGGVPVGGCVGEARTSITGNPNGVFDTAPDGGRNLIVESWQAAWNSPDTVAAKADWSACMAKAGYHRSDPVFDELGYESRQVEEGINASDEEIEEALADIDCKLDTDFVSRANAAHVATSEQLIDANQPRLNDWKTFYASAVSRATDVIAAHS